MVSRFHVSMSLSDYPAHERGARQRISGPARPSGFPRGRLGKPSAMRIIDMSQPLFLMAARIVREHPPVKSEVLVDHERGADGGSSESPVSNHTTASHRGCGRCTRSAGRGQPR